MPQTKAIQQKALYAEGITVISIWLFALHIAQGGIVAVKTINATESISLMVAK